jgi:hypothetical protein
MMQNTPPPLKPSVESPPGLPVGLGSVCAVYIVMPVAKIGTNKIGTQFTTHPHVHERGSAHLKGTYWECILILTNQQN